MFTESDSFTKALKDIIHPNGDVIIGYRDESLDKDPDRNLPTLMKKVFSRVGRYTFPKALNCYMLMCWAPR